MLGVYLTVYNKIPFMKHEVEFATHMVDSTQRDVIEEYADIRQRIMNYAIHDAASFPVYINGMQVHSSCADLPTVEDFERVLQAASFYYKYLFQVKFKEAENMPFPVSMTLTEKEFVDEYNYIANAYKQAHLDNKVTVMVNGVARDGFIPVEKIMRSMQNNPRITKEAFQLMKETDGLLKAAICGHGFGTVKKHGTIFLHTEAKSADEIAPIMELKQKLIDLYNGAGKFKFESTKDTLTDVCIVGKRLKNYEYRFMDIITMEEL